MEWLDKEIKLYINNKGPFNLYIINYYFKSCLLTPLILPTLTLAVLNDLFITKPPLPINITAPFIKIIAAINYSKDLATLVKICTEGSKYSGKDSNFNCKLMIFNNLYNRVGIP